MSQPSHPLAILRRPARSRRLLGCVRSGCILLPLAASVCSDRERSEFAADSSAVDPEHPSRIELPVATRAQPQVDLGLSREP